MLELWFLCMTRCLNVLYKHMKFRWNISKCYQIIEWTHFFVTDRWTDGWTQCEKQSVSRPFQGGGGGGGGEGGGRHKYLTLKENLHFVWFFKISLASGDQTYHHHKKAIQTLGFLKRNIWVHNKDMKSVAIYKTLVRPHLAYTSTVWHPHSTTDINKVEAVQTHQDTSTLRPTDRSKLSKTITGSHSSPGLLSIEMPSLPTYRPVPPWHSLAWLCSRWSMCLPKFNPF